MLTKTSLSAIRTLLHLVGRDRGQVLAPRAIAIELGESPTYLAKVTRSLVRAGILRAERGMKGGVRLNRAPAGITLLAVVEACQGAIMGNYCQSGCDLDGACSYHHAAAELHEAIVGVLSRWTIEDLNRKPRPLKAVHGLIPCMITGAVAVEGRRPGKVKR